MASLTMSIFMAEPQKIAQLAAEAILIGYPYGTANNTINEVAKQLKTPGSQINTALLKLMNKANTPQGLIKETVETICKTLKDSFCGDEEYTPNDFIRKLTGKSPLNVLLVERLGEQADIVLKILKNALQINFKNRSTLHNVSYYIECINTGGAHRDFVNAARGVLYDL